MNTTASDPRPIGVLDSGVGGLSVWREITRHCPQEASVYIADQAHVPYGPRPPAEILQLTRQLVERLRTHDCKLVVVACNSASAAALQHLRRGFPDLPFVGMEPAIKPAAAESRKRIAGVLATPATLSGELYRGTVARHARDMRIVADGCPGLVDAIEQCRDDVSLHALLETFIAPARDAGADVMVLACTHYPLIKEQIASHCGESMQVIDPAPAIARQVGRVLDAHGLRRSADTPPSHRFYTTADDAQRLAAPAHRWLGVELEVGLLDRHMRETPIGAGSY